MKKKYINQPSIATLKKVLDPESDILCELDNGKPRFYRRIFEDGDYVRQQDGDLLICAGTNKGRYRFYAAFTTDGELEYPNGEFYQYGAIMPGDRLCTDEEEMRLNTALAKDGKIFDCKHNIMDDMPLHQILQDDKEYRAEKQHSDIPAPSRVGIDIITISRRTGIIDIPSELSSETLNHILVRCADILRARAENNNIHHKI